MASRWRAAEGTAAATAEAAPPPPSLPAPSPNSRSVEPPPPGSSGCMSLLSPLGERRGTGEVEKEEEEKEAEEESRAFRSSVAVVVVVVAVVPALPSTFLHSRGSSSRPLASPRERSAAYAAATRGWKRTGARARCCCCCCCGCGSPSPPLPPPPLLFAASAAAAPAHALAHHAALSAAKRGLSRCHRSSLVRDREPPAVASVDSAARKKAWSSAVNGGGSRCCSCG